MRQDARAAAPNQDWTLVGPFGPELWRRRDGRFATVETGGEPIRLPTDPVTSDRLRLRDARCGHTGPFPLAFRFCPECGVPLAEPPPPPVSVPWSPPFGAADGLPEIQEPRAPDPGSGEEVALPEGPSPMLAVAGTPPMLLACEAAGGRIAAWSEGAALWIDRAWIAPCVRLDRRSWAGCADADGLALPTDGGPVWLDLRQPRGVPVVAGDRLVPLAGPAALRGRTMMPVQGPDGMAMALLDRQAGGWTTVPVPDLTPARSRTLSAPVVSAGMAFWYGPDGLLTAWHGLDGLRTGWEAWADGIHPFTANRPVLERNGQPHLLARLDPRTLAFVNLCVPFEPKPAAGYMLGSGRAVFREGTRMRLPWDEKVAAEYPLPDDRFLLPLLALGQGRTVLAVCDGRDRLGSFVGDPLADRHGPEHLCTLVYSPGPRRLEPLGCVLRARETSDLSVVVHDGWLYALGALDSRCHRWRLEPV